MEFHPNYKYIGRNIKNEKWVCLITITPASNHLNYFFISLFYIKGSFEDYTKKPIHKNSILMCLKLLTASNKIDLEEIIWEKELNNGINTLEHRNSEPIKQIKDVYFIGCDESNLIKIGSSISPESRMEEIQRMSPVKLYLMGIIAGGGIAVELKLHKKFKHLRKYGEWFQAKPELLNYIKELKLCVK